MGIFSIVCDWVGRNLAGRDRGRMREGPEEVLAP